MPTHSAPRLLSDALRRFTRALHAAHPRIASEGVRPLEPGLFIGEIAGREVQLVPGKRNSRLFIDKVRVRGSRSYFRWGFSLFKKGAAMRWPFHDDETRLVLWLTTAAMELEAKAPRSGAISGEDSSHVASVSAGARESG